MSVHESECSIIEFFEYFEDDSYYYIVFEDFDMLLDSYLKSKKAFTEEEIFDIVKNLSAAINYIHTTNCLLGK